MFAFSKFPFINASDFDEFTKRQKGGKGEGGREGGKETRPCHWKKTKTTSKPEILLNNQALQDAY